MLAYGEVTSVSAGCSWLKITLFGVTGASLRVLFLLLDASHRVQRGQA